MWWWLQSFIQLFPSWTVLSLGKMGILPELYHRIFALFGQKAMTECLKGKQHFLVLLQAELNASGGLVCWEACLSLFLFDCTILNLFFCFLFSCCLTCSLFSMQSASLLCIPWMIHELYILVAILPFSSKVDEFFQPSVF